MNTPAHAVFNLLVLDAKDRSHWLWPVALGSILPDLPMVSFYAWQKLVLGTPERVIWRERYYLESWQAFFDLFNSLPILGVGLVVAWWLGASRWLALLASMVLHCLCDLPLHHDDAHRHFWPISDWRFESPVSYWDPSHYGQWISLAEIALVLGGSAWLFLHHESRKARLLVGAVGGLYLAYLGYVLVVWV